MDTDTYSVTDVGSFSADENISNDYDPLVEHDLPVPPLGGVPPERKLYRLRNLSNIDYNDGKSIRQLMKWSSVIVVI